ncbi:MAG: hypothetical protein AYK19_15965 [Theionarchaea archaeon DG-70-1]|nr:MAG: hypothetical protein AYK19_15965 [Theionarchaea archaeon DG-70-1]
MKGGDGGKGGERGFSLININPVYSPTSMCSMRVQRVCKKNEGGEIHGSKFLQTLCDLLPV